MIDNVDVMPGQKTNIVATLYTLVQLAAVFGLVTPEQLEVANQAAAVLFGTTLGLKARRTSKG